ncbi:MAG: hypothetical protein CL916_12895 [Deltaproteobacteria bacterium]|nr:hypothetical protein [Deltaproteobacteria bacterium]
MSKYRTIITQLEWIKLSTMETQGRTLVSPTIQECIQAIQKDIRSDIRLHIQTAPLSPVIIESLRTHVPQDERTTILWKELKKDIDILIEQAQLLDSIIPTTPQLEPTKEISVQPSKKHIAHSPFAPQKEAPPTPPITLFLPNHLSFIKAELTTRLEETRTNIAIEYGCTIPIIECEHSDNLDYELLFKNLSLGKGHIPQTPFFALAPAEQQEQELLSTEPAYHKRGVWLAKDQRKDDWKIISPTLILESHVHELIVRNIHKVFDWNSFNHITEQLEQNHPDLIGKVIPDVLSRKQLFEIYASLLREDIPIHNHESLLKTIYVFRSKNKGTQFLVEQIRRRLFDPARIDSNYQYATLSKPLEKLLRQALTKTSTKESFKIDEAIRTRIIQTVTELSTQSTSMILLMVPPPLRPAMQSLFTPHNLHEMRLLSTDDLTPAPDRLFAELTLNEVLYR